MLDTLLSNMDNIYSVKSILNTLEFLEQSSTDKSDWAATAQQNAVYSTHP